MFQIFQLVSQDETHIIKNIILSGLVAVIFTIPFQIAALLFVFAFYKFIDSFENFILTKRDNKNKSL